MLAGALTGACGGGSGGTTTKAGWTKSHGPIISTTSIDIDVANQALGTGQRPDVLSACNQLQDDLPKARKALPAPNPAVDGALRTAFDTITTGVADCLEAARVTNQATLTEKAQAEIKDARVKMDAANKAIADWQ
ncbi:MAG TPA: hypothetical protein VHT97_10020 [Acidimicrobiales bacterium]|nr:hypothetical protein [Acidimicrobiales bacterium]